MPEILIFASERWPGLVVSVLLSVIISVIITLLILSKLFLKRLNTIENVVDKMKFDISIISGNVADYGKALSALKVNISKIQEDQKEETRILHDKLDEFSKVLYEIKGQTLAKHKQK